MPKIRTYESQVSAPSGAVQSSANPEAAGAFGEGLQKLGQATVQSAEMFEKGRTQKNVLKAHEFFASQRYKYNTRINEETKSGTLDSEKLYNDYETEYTKYASEMDTPESRDWFEQQGTNLGYDLKQSSAISQSQMTGRLAIESINKSMDLDSATLHNSPGSFQKTYQSAISFVDKQVELGKLDVANAAEFKRKIGNDYAENSVRGFMEISADAAKTNLDSGMYDEYLTGDQKKSLYGEIRTYKNLEKSEVQQQYTLQKIAQEKASDAWQNENIQKLNENTLSPKEIYSSPMQPETKQHWVNMLNNNLQQNLKTDNAVKMQLMQRIMLPHGDPGRINNENDLYQYVGNGITVTDVKQMLPMIAKNPDNERMNAQRKSFMDMAKNTILRKNPADGTRVGYDKLQSLTDLSLRLEEQYKKEGKDPAAVYDVSNKDSVWNKVGSYKVTTKDILQPKQAVKNEVKTKPMPNETPAQFLKRIKGNK